MAIDSARKVFEALAARVREPRLADAVGTWELQVDGKGTWTVSVDHGVLHVANGSPTPPTRAAGAHEARLVLGEEELIRLARGEGHENLLMGLIRGDLAIEGDLAFAQRLQALLPFEEQP